MEKMSRFKRYLGQRYSDLEQTPAIKPFVVATGRDTNFLSLEDSRMPASG